MINYCDHGVGFEIKGDKTTPIEHDGTEIDMVYLVSHSCSCCNMTVKKHCKLLMDAIYSEDVITLH